MLIQRSVKSYIDQLSSDAPTPGGGSASAVVASLGVSLLLMVAKITRKKLGGAQQKKIDKTISLLNRVLKDTEQIIDLDVRVYQALMKSYQAAKKTKINRGAAQRKIEISLINSFRLQADLALLILMAKGALPFLHSAAKGSIRNDLSVARGFLDGAFHGAVSTARINLAYLHSRKKSHFERAVASLEKKFYGIKI